MTLTNLKRFMAVALATLLLSLQTMGNGVYASGLETKGNEDKKVSKADRSEAINRTINLFKDSNFLKILGGLKENKDIIDSTKNVATSFLSLENDKSSDEDKSDESSDEDSLENDKSSDEDESDESSDKDDDKPKYESVSTKDSTDNGGASSLNDSNSLEQQRKEFLNSGIGINIVSNMAKTFSSDKNFGENFGSLCFEIAKNFVVTKKNFEESTENPGMPDVQVFKNNFKELMEDPTAVNIMNNAVNKVISDKDTFENIFNVMSNPSESK
ncbi:MAG: hypothetical protein LBB13_02205 [Rickettsiales bacterium]|jgi:hypothetical protein|nr:hypothetical protein [Rickettsiales bacterium]